MIGQTISHYYINEKLGSGGMGEVYKAEDTKLKRTVALKFLPPSLSSDPQAKKRFTQEARAASALDHPNICTIHEIGETDDGRSFIAMACYDGKSLKDMIRSDDVGVGATSRRPALSTDQTISIIIQIAKGLARAHEEGIVHRDIKPANIMITGRSEVKILDFGLAKLAGQSRLTKTGSTVGTLAYMSPEQAKGEPVNQRTDIWSLGVILYEMLTGDIPFRGDYDQAVIYSILNEDPEPITETEDIPHELHTIIKKALSKDVNQRYQSIEELLEDFKPLSTAAAIPVELALKKVARRFWRKHKVISLITAAVFAGLIFLWIFKPGVFSDQYAGPREIAVVSFENMTGDPEHEILADVVPNLLRTALSQSNQIRILPLDYMKNILKQLGIADVRTIDREMGYQICEKVKAFALVTGSFAKLGNLYVTDVQVIDPLTKDIIVPVSTRGEDISSIAARQIDEISQTILERLDAVDSTYLAEKKPVLEITTSSLTAYQYFVRGMDEFHRLYFPESARLFERAVKLDSTFVLALWNLARVYNAQRQYDKEKKAIIKAFQYADNAPQTERLAIYAHYTYTVEKDLEKMVRFLDAALKKNPYNWVLWGFYFDYYRWKKNYSEMIYCIEKLLEINPEDKFGLNLACYAYASIGNKNKALEYIEKYKSIMPGQANAFHTPGEVYYHLGMFDRSMEQFRELKQMYPEWRSHQPMIYMYTLLQEYDKVRQELDIYLEEATSSTSVAARKLYRAQFFYYMGEISRAFNEINSALDDHSLRQDLRMRALELKAYFLLNENDVVAANEVFHLSRAAKDRPDIFDLHQSLIFLKQGKLDSCRHYINQTFRILDQAIQTKEKELHEPEWLRLFQMHYDYIQAELLLAADSADQAIEFCSDITYPGPLRGSAYSLYLRGNVFLNVPFEKDIIARALVKKGDLEGAIKAYENWVKFQPDQQDRFFISPKYHYRLAKLYEQNDQHRKAIDRYKIFLDIWKYADKDLPELVDAKKRLAALEIR